MNVLVTAGPTREPIDPVRFLTNRSSGKMGYAVAEAFAKAGHTVLLVSGPTSLDVPDYVDFVPVTTAAEMHEVVGHHLKRMDIAVFVAAVADYTPAKVAPQKIKKEGDSLMLELVKTKDILGSARGEFGFAGTLVGFAAETENLEANARRKLTGKGCDLVVANDVSEEGRGFDSHGNEVTLCFPDRTLELPHAPKSELAKDLVETILDLHLTKISTSSNH
ncbi:phosphopantothenoylcysteine decarboxylase [Luteolibacter pohnpeiensis]|uniref:Phosphopantothenoylcysteine decarboxylase n=1 Tax=Luteolibacter pohnpeiensis TaxID=454153 RepID=A0A934S2G5_9BACT|nr:phosphopantothenoylcysteine decarboxylase [Luteolibacter pohnpeiensis]